MAWGLPASAFARLVPAKQRTTFYARDPAPAASRLLRTIVSVRPRATQDRMDLRKLRHAVTLGRTLNFTKAADELGISQPVLSRSIQVLERETKVRLFDRDRANVRVTPSGRAFIQRAIRILADMNDLEDSVRKVADGRSGVLAFGMGTLPASALLADILPARMADTPDLGFSVAVRNPDALLKLLEAEEIEFFISAEAFFPEPANIRGTFAGYFPLAPLVRAGHPLLDAAPGHRNNYRLLMTARADDAPQAPLSLRPHVSLAPPGLIEDNVALAEITATTDAVWLTSPFIVQKDIATGRLVELPPALDEEPVRLRMMEYRLDRRTLSPAASAMRDRLRARIQTLWNLRQAAGH